MSGPDGNPESSISAKPVNKSPKTQFLNSDHRLVPIDCSLVMITVIMIIIIITVYLAVVLRRWVAIMLGMMASTT